MNIDFNNVRRKAIACYSGLVRTLKAKTDETGRITVERYQIEDDMENLCDALVAIALTHDPGNLEFQDVLGDERVPSLCDEEEERGDEP